MEETEGVSWRDELRRLEAARVKLAKHGDVADGGVDGGAALNPRAPRPDHKDAGRGAGGNSRGARASQDSSVDIAEPFRPNGRPLADGGAKRGGIGKNSPGSRRGVGGSPQARGQDAREAALLEGYWKQIQYILKRVLIYAGFDLEGDSRALTDEEVEEYRPAVSKFFQRVGIALDWCVTHSNAGRAESDIWMFDEEESDQLAVIYLKRASKIGWMAEVARQVEHLEDVGDAAVVANIVGKRLWATGMFYPTNGGFKVWMR